MKLTEQEIVEGCLKGDRKMQKALYETYSRRMMAVCSRYITARGEAEDLFHDTFIKVFHNLKQFKGGSLEGWMRRIFVNEAINYYKRKFTKYRFDSIDQAQEIVGQEPAILDNIYLEELLKLVNTLPEGCKVVFNLYAVEGFDHAEIAKLLGISEGTSRSQLHRAKHLLKEKLGPQKSAESWTTTA